MKILILADDFLTEGGGGASAIAFDMAKGLAEKGEEVLVFTTTRKKEEEGKEKKNGFVIEKVFSNYKEKWRGYVCVYNFFVLRKLKKTLRDFRPEIVHAHNIHKNISYASLKAAKKSGAKVFITMHDVMSFTYGKLKTEKYLKTAIEGKPNYRVTFLENLKKAKKRFNPLRNFLIRYYLKYADKILAVSSALKEALRQNGISGAEVLYNGIEIIEFEKEIKNFELKERMRMLEGKKVVLFGGRLSEAKGIKQIKQAMKKVKEEIPEAELAAFGGEVKEIFSFGWVKREELGNIYKRADLIVTPSVCFDSFPTVNLEAMIFEKPVVATIFGGSKEAVKDGKTGYIVNPFNTDELALKIEIILRDEKIRDEMGKRGKERVEELFSLKDWIEKTKKVYEETNF